MSGHTRERCWTLYPHLRPTGDPKPSSDLTVSTAATAVASPQAPTGSDPWIGDSGATDHMTGTRRLFTTFVPLASPSRVLLADGSYSTVTGTGDVHISEHLTLHRVLFVPSLKLNLLSISRLCDEVHFTASLCSVQDSRTGAVLGSGHRTGGLYHFFPPAALTVAAEPTYDLLHSRLGHPSPHIMQMLPAPPRSPPDVTRVKLGSTRGLFTPPVLAFGLVSHSR